MKVFFAQNKVNNNGQDNGFIIQQVRYVLRNLILIQMEQSNFGNAETCGDDQSCGGWTKSVKNILYQFGFFKFVQNL